MGWDSRQMWDPPANGGPVGREAHGRTGKGDDEETTLTNTQIVVGRGRVETRRLGVCRNLGGLWKWTEEVVAQNVCPDIYFHFIPIQLIIRVGVQTLSCHIRTSLVYIPTSIFTRVCTSAGRGQDKKENRIREETLNWDSWPVPALLIPLSAISSLPASCILKSRSLGPRIGFYSPSPLSHTRTHSLTFCHSPIPTPLRLPAPPDSPTDAQSRSQLQQRTQHQQQSATQAQFNSGRVLSLSLFFWNGLTNTHPRVNHSRRPFVIPVVFLLTPFLLHSASLFLYLFVCPLIVAYPPHAIVSLWHPLCYIALRYVLSCSRLLRTTPRCQSETLESPTGIINSQPVSSIHGDKRINIKYEKYTSTRYVKHQIHINKTLNENQKVQTVKKVIKHLIV